MEREGYPDKYKVHLPTIISKPQACGEYKPDESRGHQSEVGAGFLLLGTAPGEGARGAQAYNTLSTNGLNPFFL